MASVWTAAVSDHGTESAYKRHQRNHTNPCLPCKQAHATAEAERRARRNESHGTPEGITFHRRRRTPVCDLCLDVACYMERLNARDYYAIRLGAEAA